jgi:hypothetical protein
MDVELALEPQVDVRSRRTARRAAICAAVGAVLAAVGGLLNWLTVSADLPIASASGYELPIAGWLIGATSLASLIAVTLILVKPRHIAAAWTAGAIALVAATIAGITLITLRTGQEVTGWIPHEVLPHAWRSYTPNVSAGAGLWMYFVAYVIQCSSASIAALNRTRLQLSV